MVCTQQAWALDILSTPLWLTCTTQAIPAYIQDVNKQDDSAARQLPYHQALFATTKPDDGVGPIYVHKPF